MKTVCGKYMLISKTLYAIALTAVLTVPYSVPAADNSNASTQQSLDAQCEAARELKLAPERANYIEECVREKIKDSRKECERFYSDYGAQSGPTPPLYYDLPACVKAFEFRQNNG